MEKIKVCAYCRVSTDTEDQRNSFESQKSYFYSKFQENPDYECYDIYADRGISGTKLRRPEFDRMLVDAGLEISRVTNVQNDQRKSMVKYAVLRSSTVKPKFKYIYVSNTSRFARNILIMDVINELAQNGVYVRFTDIGKSSENKDDMGLIPIFLTFDEMDSRRKSDSIIWGHEATASKGVIHSNSKLFGYKYHVDENRLEVIPEEAEIVRKIFALSIEGYGYRVISNKLSELGHSNRNGNKFLNVAIGAILSNEKYMGMNNRLKHDGRKAFTQNTYAKVKDIYRIEVTDKIPPIVSVEDFSLAKIGVAGRRNITKRSGVNRGNSKYAKLVFCGICGHSYYANICYTKGAGGVKISYPIYNCSQRVIHGKSVCRNIVVKSSEIDFSIGFLAQHYQTYINSTKKLLIDQCRNVKESIEKKIDQQDAELILHREADLSTLIRSRNKLYDLRISEKGIDDDYFFSKKQELDTNIRELEDEISVISKSNRDIQNEMENIDKIIMKVESLDAKETYTYDEMNDEIISIHIHRAVDIMLAENIIRRPQLQFRFRLNEQIKELTSKYHSKEITPQVLIRIANTPVDEMVMQRSYNHNINVILDTHGDISIYREKETSEAEE